MSLVPVSGGYFTAFGSSKVGYVASCVVSRAGTIVKNCSVAACLLTKITLVSVLYPVQYQHIEMQINIKCIFPTLHHEYLSNLFKCL